MNIYCVRNIRTRIAICYSKLFWLLFKIEFEWQISRKSCYLSPSYKIKNKIYLEYYNLTIATHLLQIATQFTI